MRLSKCFPWNQLEFRPAQTIFALPSINWSVNYFFSFISSYYPTMWWWFNISSLRSLQSWPMKHLRWSFSDDVYRILKFSVVFCRFRVINFITSSSGCRWRWMDRKNENVRNINRKEILLFLYFLVNVSNFIVKLKKNSNTLDEKEN